MEQFEQAITSMMAQYKIPGASIACLVEDEIILLKGFGARDLDSNQPTTPNTLYGFGSNTKSYLALSILQQVEKGNINLTDPINKFLPINIGDKENPITIHHLLSHSSGLPALGSGDEVLACRLLNLDEYYIPLSSWDDYFRFMKGASNELMAKPGEKFAYSNEGYILLQAILEKITKVKCADYIREHVFKPLEMNRSLFREENFKKEEDRMRPYFGKQEGYQIIEAIPSKHIFHEFAHGAGGLISSVVEQLSYLKMYMNNGIFKGTKLIESNLLHQMLEIHIETDLVKSMMAPMGREGYGYGWVILEDFFGHRLVAHSGNTMSATASLLFVPEKKIGIAMGCNSNRGGSLNLGFSIILMATLLGKNPLKDLDFLTIDEKLDTLTGEYETYKAIHKMRVFKRGGLLYIEAENRPISFAGIPPGMNVPLFPIDENYDEFKFEIFTGSKSKISVEFMLKKKGNVDFAISDWIFHKVKK